MSNIHVVNGGATFTSVSFVPKVTQSQLPGKTAGLTLRYTSEKYFNMICVENCNVDYDSKTLKPGESHTLRVKISVERL